MNYFDSKIENDHFYIFLINPNSEVDYTSIDEITVLIKKGIESGYKQIFIDMKNLIFIDSSVLGKLISATKQVKVSLLNLNDNISKLLLLTGVFNYFDIVQ